MRPFIALVFALVAATPDAHACADVPMYPIQPGAALYAFPSYTRQLVTADSPNLWSFAVLGQFGITHFTGRIRDASGGALTVYQADPRVTITKPTPDEIDYAATFDSDNDTYFGFQFQSAGPRVVFEPRNDSVYSETDYPKPDGHGGAILYDRPIFALTLEAGGGTISDPAVLFCDSYE